MKNNYSRSNMEDQIWQSSVFKKSVDSVETQFSEFFEVAACEFIVRLKTF